MDLRLQPSASRRMAKTLDRNVTGILVLKKAITPYRAENLGQGWVGMWKRTGCETLGGGRFGAPIIQNIR